jgi:hypothetical protein
MKNALCWFVSFILIFNANLLWSLSKARAAPKTRCAVLDLDITENVPPEVRVPLTDRLRAKIFASGKFEMVERSDMDKVLREMELSCSDMTSKECQIEYGQLLQAEKLVTGSISKIGKTYLITIQITDVNQAKVERLEADMCKDCATDDLLESIDQIAEKLVGTGKRDILPPALSPTKGYGSLQINTNPQGAAVYLDAESRGNTPLTLSQISEGVHKLILIKEGYENISKGVEIKKDQTTPVKEILIQQTGSLKVETEPRNARVFLDNKYVGTSPVETSGVSVGKHTVKVQHPDFKTVEEKVQVDYQQTALVKKVLSGLPATLLITSIPSGGDVKINGKKVGSTPLSGLQIEPGEYKIDISMAGYKTYSKKISLASNQKTDISAVLNRETATQTTTTTTTRTTGSSQRQQKKSGGGGWLWIGLGVAAAAGIAAAAAGGGGGGGGGDDDDNGPTSGNVPISW